MSTPNFFWCHPLNNLVRYSILNIVCTPYHFSPKLWAKASCMNHTICHLFQGTIFPFSNTILLWTIRHCMLQLNTFSGTIVFKSVADVLSTIVCPQTFDRLSRLFFNQGFKHNKSVKGLTFIFQKIDPCVSRIVINECK